MKRNLMILAGVVALAFSSAALADKEQGDVCNGGGCVYGDSNSNNTTNNQGGTGIGVGIGIGKGGNANADASVRNSVKVRNTATGGSVKNSGNSANFNLNKATGGQGGAGGAGGSVYIGGGEGQGGTLSPKSKSKSSASNGDQILTVNEAGTNDKDVEIANIQAGAQRDAANSQPTKIEVKTPGVASVPNIYPTSPCMGSTSAGVSFMGGAFSGGSSWKDDDCSYRETARMFDQLGYKKDGLVVMCQSEYAKQAPSCKALAAEAKKQASLAEENAKLREQLAARDSARTEEKRKTDATVRASTESNTKQVVSTSYVSDGTCGAPATTETAGWKFDMNQCKWVPTNESL